ncbi:MAG TPA: DGQHR domain-containing protein [Candidatus Paceibacterota bacterium]
MAWKLPSPAKKKRIETKDKAEAARLKKDGYLQKKLKSGRIVLEKKFAKWELFQEEVRVFLEALGFQDTESGHSSWLGRYQIDVVGGIEGTFLVFECKSSHDPKLSKTLTKEINVFAGKKIEIEKAIREKYGAKYNEVKFVLALEDVHPTEDDIKTARENDIYLWGSSYLKTGKDLFTIIGPLTAHYVLKELGVSPKTIRDEEGGADYKVPSFCVTVGEQKIYSFFLPAEKLLNLVYVFRLQPGNEDAYQRFISKKRILGTGGITQFIDSGRFFKTSVVCSFERQIKFDPKPTGLLLSSKDVEFGILSIPKLYGTVWIIDGQHRIYGYAGVNPEMRKTNIGVVAYQEVDKRQQARDFIDINQKQKPVDPNTLWDLLSQTDPYSTEGAITKIAKELNNKKGIFKGKVLIPGKSFHAKRSSYPLKLSNICLSLSDRRLVDFNVRDNLYKTTSDVRDDNRYPDSVIEHSVNVLDEYFLLLWEIAEKVPDWRKGFILNNNGFNVFLRVLAEILKFQSGNWSKQEAKKILTGPIESYFEAGYEDLSDIRTFTSNEAGRAKEALDIIKRINEKNETFARDFIKEAERRERLAYEKSDPYQILKDLESNLRQFIENKLSQATDHWWKQRIPKDVQEKAELKLEKSQSPWPWVKAEDKYPIAYIDFPDYAKIILRADNRRHLFPEIKSDAPIESIVTKLKELEDIRNKIAHSRPITVQESTTLRLYTTQILQTINPHSEPS